MYVYVCVYIYIYIHTLGCAPSIESKTGEGLMKHRMPDCA